MTKLKGKANEISNEIASDITNEIASEIARVSSRNNVTRNTSFTYAGALREITCLLRIRKKE